MPGKRHVGGFQSFFVISSNRQFSWTPSRRLFFFFWRNEQLLGPYFAFSYFFLFIDGCQRAVTLDKADRLLAIGFFDDLRLICFDQNEIALGKWRSISQSSSKPTTAIFETNTSPLIVNWDVLLVDMSTSLPIIHRVKYVPRLAHPAFLYRTINPNITTAH